MAGNADVVRLQKTLRRDAPAILPAAEVDDTHDPVFCKDLSDHVQQRQEAFTLSLQPIESRLS